MSDLSDLSDFWKARAESLEAELTKLHHRMPVCYACRKSAEEMDRKLGTEPVWGWLPDEVEK